MRIEDFRSLVDRLARDVPEEFRDGVVAIDVSPKALPHPVHPDVYTLGECVPLEWTGTGTDLHSRVILYYGSFMSLARLEEPGAFDWREQAWETLTHELRHHLEWRANVDALAAYDWAAEENFKRQEGQPFDPTFYRSGEDFRDGVWKVEDDLFVVLADPHARGTHIEIPWHGRAYTVVVPMAAPPAYLFVILEGLLDPPPGDAVLVVKPTLTLRDLFRHRPAPVQQVAPVTLLDA